MTTPATWNVKVGLELFFFNFDIQVQYIYKPALSTNYKHLYDHAW